jgi:hypothetical protein
MDIILTPKPLNFYLRIVLNSILVFIVGLTCIIKMYIIDNYSFNIWYLIVLSPILLFIIYATKRNFFYITKVILAGDYLTIGYYRINKYIEVNSDIQNCKISKISISRPPHQYAIEFIIENKIRQYPGFYFDKSIWKDNVIDNVYQKLIKYQEKIKE